MEVPHLVHLVTRSEPGAGELHQIQKLHIFQKQLLRLLQRQALLLREVFQILIGNSRVELDLLQSAFWILLFNLLMQRVLLEQPLGH